VLIVKEIQPLANKAVKLLSVAYPHGITTGVLLAHLFSYENKSTQPKFTRHETDKL